MRGPGLNIWGQIFGYRWILLCINGPELRECWIFWSDMVCDRNIGLKILVDISLDIGCSREYDLHLDWLRHILGQV